MGANWLKIYVDYPISCFSCSINSIHLLFDKYINQSMNQYIIYYIYVYADRYAVMLPFTECTTVMMHEQKNG